MAKLNPMLIRFLQQPQRLVHLWQMAIALLYFNFFPFETPYHFSQAMMQMMFSHKQCFGSALEEQVYAWGLYEILSVLLDSINAFFCSSSHVDSVPSEGSFHCQNVFGSIITHD